jgi:hypothetical protein
VTSIQPASYVRRVSIISNASSENNREDDFSGGDDDFLGFYYE